MDLGILPIEPSAEVDWLLGKPAYGRKDDLKRIGNSEPPGKDSENERRISSSSEE